MKYGYIGTIHSAKEFQENIALFEQQGIPLDNVSINTSFDEFVASLTEGDTAVVYSYTGLFTSLDTYLTAVIELAERGVVIKSLKEPNISVTDSNRAFVGELYALGRQLRSASSLKNVNKLKNEGRRVGRPAGTTSDTLEKVAQIDKLCKQSGISVTKACKMVSCQPRTYYRIKNKVATKNK